MIGQKEIIHMHKILWRKKTAFELYYHKQQLCWNVRNIETQKSTKNFHSTSVKSSTILYSIRIIKICVICIYENMSD